MNKTFLRAINDLKKQKEKETSKKTVEEDKNADELSSNEEKYLKEMGALKKKIHKEPHHKEKKWRHDYYRQEPKPSAKPLKQLRELCIRFSNNPGYSKIYPLVKHIKIFIRQIDDSRIVFNTSEAYEEAKRIFAISEFTFTTAEGQEQGK